jgi:hypothetical protein
MGDDDKRFEKAEKLLKDLPKGSVVKIAFNSLANSSFKERTIYVEDCEDIGKIAVEGEQKETKREIETPKTEEEKPKANSFEDLVQKIRKVKTQEELDEVGSVSPEAEGEISAEELANKKSRLSGVYNVKFALLLDENSDEDLEEFLAGKKGHEGE